MVQQETYKHKINKLKLLQKKDVYTDLLKGPTRDIRSQHGHKLNIEINFLVQQSVLCTFHTWFYNYTFYPILHEWFPFNAGKSIWT